MVRSKLMIVPGHERIRMDVDSVRKTVKGNGSFCLPIFNYVFGRRHNENACSGNFSQIIVQIFLDDL